MMSAARSAGAAASLFVGGAPVLAAALGAHVEAVGVVSSAAPEAAFLAIILLLAAVADRQSADINNSKSAGREMA